MPIHLSPEIDGQSFLPQLQGKKGQPRKWIYNWYSRSGEAEKASVFARTHRFKLYTNGEFYEIPRDYSEKMPLAIDHLKGQVIIDYKMLKQVLDNYRNSRMDAIP